jgi:Transposase
VAEHLHDDSGVHALGQQQGCCRVPPVVQPDLAHARKTDVKDAEWIAQLLEHGLLRPSFVPPADSRRLRMLTRYREQLMGDRTREAMRLELMLEDASIKLSVVASSLTTVSARAMLAALIDGNGIRGRWWSWPRAGCGSRSWR